jgi:colicin import membrane protein
MYEQAEEAQPAATAGAPAPMQAPEGAAGAPAPMQAPEGAAAAPAPSRDESNTIANRAPVRRPVATVPAEPSPEPAVTGAADDYGAEEQSPRRFAQAPAEVEIPATGQALGGRGGYLDADKNSSRVARRDAESQPAAKPEPKLEAAKEESRRAKAGKKLDLAGSLDEGLEQETRTADVSSKQPSGAPGSGSGAAQGARAGGSQAPQKPVAAPAKTKSPPAAPPPAQAAPAQDAPPQAAPAQAAPPAADRDQAEDPGDSAAPADRKAPARTEAKARERSDGTATRVSDLHQKALAAAARGDCATVRSSGSAIRQLSPSYHRDSFARDARLQKCLSEAVKKK